MRSKNFAQCFYRECICTRLYPSLAVFNFDPVVQLDKKEHEPVIAYNTIKINQTLKGLT